jgi:hypothetical protein
MSTQSQTCYEIVGGPSITNGGRSRTQGNLTSIPTKESIAQRFLVIAARVAEGGLPVNVDEARG